MKPFAILLLLFSLAFTCVAQDTVLISCDSIYTGKAFRATLRVFKENETDETIPNVVFLFSKTVHGREVLLFRDSVYSLTREVRFEDFNNDGIKDILLQHYSDVRSNQSNYLYLVDTAKDRLKKIKGFEDIKNPVYLQADNLVSNMVVSGANWSGFYQVQGDHVVDFGITVDADDDKARERALRTIRKRKDWVAPAHGHRK